MEGLTLNVTVDNVEQRLTTEFLIPISEVEGIKAATMGRLLRMINLEINRIVGRVLTGDTRVLSEKFGCWIKVV